MADGTTFSIDIAAAPPRLADSLGPERHLVAQCPSCTRAAACDPAPWLAEGLAALPLRSFQSRLRCVCGGRQARLEVRPGAYAPPIRPDLFIFR